LHATSGKLSLGEVFWHFPLFPKCSYQVLIGFPSCFQFIPHVLIIFPNMFPIAPFFNPSCFGKCCPPLTYIDGPKGRNTTLLLVWGVLHFHSPLNLFFPYHSHFILEWKFSFMDCPDFWLWERFFPSWPINQFIIK
jgi:hypothetical protein